MDYLLYAKHFVFILKNVNSGHCLYCARHGDKHFTCMIWLDHHNTPLKLVFIIPNHEELNWHPIQWPYLPKVPLVPVPEPEPDPDCWHLGPAA